MCRLHVTRYGNQVLLWKQPHPIFFAELEYRLRPTRATLDKWADIIEGTAEYIADYPTKDAKTVRYSLAYVMPPSEQGITRDSVFDLAYWRWALDKAQEWRERRGLARSPHWDEVRQNLAPLPVVDGLFVHSDAWRNTYSNPNRSREHPDPAGVLGMFPPTDSVNTDTARRTVAKVWTTWNWNSCWGWDFAWMAMGAGRTGSPISHRNRCRFSKPAKDRLTHTIMTHMHFLKLILSLFLVGLISVSALAQDQVAMPIHERTCTALQGHLDIYSHDGEGRFPVNVHVIKGKWGTPKEVHAAG